VIRERILEVSLDDVVELFEIRKWKFFEVDPELGLVRVEVPRGYSESYVVEIPFTNEAQYKGIAEKLVTNGFIKQTIKMRSSY